MTTATHAKAVARAALGALLLAAACRGGGAPEPPAPSARRYTVRGEVVRLTVSGVPSAELSIRHEAVPDFVDRKGAVVGMPAMVMPFTVGKDVPLTGIAPGDKIRFRFSMDWSANRMEIEAIEELPPETALDFQDRVR